MSQLNSGGGSLTAGLQKLTSGAGQLESGLNQLSSGNSQLASGLGAAPGKIDPLISGLDKMQVAVAKFRGDLPSARDIERLQASSPGLFDSGYFVLAAVAGSPASSRNQAASVVNLHGGGTAGMIMVVPKESATTTTTQDLGKDLVAMSEGFAKSTHIEAAVGGNGGAFGDFKTEGTARIWPVVIGESIVILIMLIVMLRAVVLPIVAVAFDLLTAAATFGILSLLYSGSDALLGGPGYIDPVSIIGIFAFIFGVSMVYEVALLYRTREAFLETGDAHGAVRTGLAKTAAAATGAAAVMLAAIIPFAAVDLMSVQVFGVGVAIAIVLDALIVRPVLLPAAVVAARALELVAAVPPGTADAADRSRRPAGAADAARSRPAACPSGRSPGAVLRPLYQRPEGEGAARPAMMAGCTSTLVAAWGRREAARGPRPKRLQDEFGYMLLSTGNLLREARLDGTELGKRAAEYMDRGDLVPDELILAMVREVIGGFEGESGAARRVPAHARAGGERWREGISQLGRELGAAILIDVPDEVVMQRILARGEGRSDDNPETLRERLRVYHGEIDPLIAYYDELGLLRRVDGAGDPDAGLRAGPPLSRGVRAGSASRPGRAGSASPPRPRSTTTSPRPARASG